MWKPTSRSVLDIVCVLIGIAGLAFGVYEHYTAATFQAANERLIEEKTELERERARIVDMSIRALDRQNKVTERRKQEQAAQRDQQK